MATLNGWQRLWVVVSALWVVVWVVVGLVALLDNPATWVFDETTRVWHERWIMADSVAMANFLASLTMAVVPPVLLYAAGLVTAWVRRGFRQ